MGQFHDLLGPLAGEQGLHHFLGLAGEGLLLGQEVEGEGQGQHQVKDQGDHGGGDANGGADGGVEELIPVLPHPIQDLLLHLLAIQGEVREVSTVFRKEGGELVPPIL